MLLYNQFSHPPHFFCPSLSSAPLSTDLRAPNTPGPVSLTTPCYLFGGPRPEAGCARRLLGNVVQPPDGPGPVEWLGLLRHQNQGARARDRPVRKPRRVEAHLHTITRRPRPPTVGEPTSPACLRGNRLAAENCGKCSWAGPASTQGHKGCCYTAGHRGQNDFAASGRRRPAVTLASDHPGRWAAAPWE